MHHLLAFTVASSGTTANTQLPAVTDPVFSTRNSNFWIPERGELAAVAGYGATLNRLRITTPSLRRIMPVECPQLTGSENIPADPRINDFRDSPVPLRGGEELELQYTDSTGMDLINAAAWFRSGSVPRPGGPIYTIRGTASTTLTAVTWSQLAVTWDDDLPNGKYAIVGGLVQSATGFWFRCILQSQVWRPGGQCVTALGLMHNPIFRRGNLGEWGVFENSNMPNIEVFAEAADSSQVVFLDVVPLTAI